MIWFSETRTSRQPYAWGQKEALAWPDAGGNRGRRACCSFVFLLTGRQSGRALTLPDSPPVDVDLHGVGGVEGLVIVEDEDVAAEGVDPGRVHRCILGKGRWNSSF